MTNDEMRQLLALTDRSTDGLGDNSVSTPAYAQLY